MKKHESDDTRMGIVAGHRNRCYRTVEHAGRRVWPKAWRTIPTIRSFSVKLFRRIFCSSSIWGILPWRRPIAAPTTNIPFRSKLARTTSLYAANVTIDNLVAMIL